LTVTRYWSTVSPHLLHSVT